jgi:hypothetical protein
MFPLSTRNRLEKATWPHLSLGRIHTGRDIKRLREWIRENISGEHEIKFIKETVGKRKLIIATFLRFKNIDDATMASLAWDEYR